MEVEEARGGAAAGAAEAAPRPTRAAEGGSRMAAPVQAATLLSSHANTAQWEFCTIALAFQLALFGLYYFLLLQVFLEVVTLGLLHLDVEVHLGQLVRGILA